MQVVISEVGKDIPFQKLMNSPVGFKGRAQQIQTLQSKVHRDSIQTLKQSFGDDPEMVDDGFNIYNSHVQQTGATTGEEAE